jgi:hypothetical protein
MDYRGKTYTVLQGVERASWKWTVHLDEITVKSGSAPTREAAKIKAIWIIEKARAPKENENTRRNEIKRDADTLASLPIPEQQLLSSAVPLSNKGHDPRPKNHPRRDA